MSALKAVREQVVSALAGVVPVTPAMPGVVNPPMGWVLPDDPYIDNDGAAFNEYAVHLVLTLAAGIGTNEGQTDQLDALVSAAIPALWQFDVEQVSGLRVQEQDGPAFLTCDLTLTTRTELT